MTFVEELKNLKAKYNKVILLNATITDAGQIQSVISVLDEGGKEKKETQEFLEKVKELEQKYNQTLGAFVEMNELEVVVPVCRLVSLRPPAGNNPIPYVSVTPSNRDNQSDAVSSDQSESVPTPENCEKNNENVATEPSQSSRMDEAAKS